METKGDNFLHEAEYDGIKELDNRVPPWLMYIFYITIAWAAIYLVYYHLLKKGPLQEQEYANEVALAAKDKPVSTFDENNIQLITDTVKLAEAKIIFKQKNCFTCHGPDGQGNAVGPNLTDKNWIHGGKPQDVFKTIKYGYPTKGMLSFKDQLSDEKIVLMTSYILVKLKGSNPANPKAPQGDIIVE